MYLLTIHLTVIQQRLQNGVLQTIILFCRLALPEIFAGGCLCRRTAGTAIPTVCSLLWGSENQAVMIDFTALTHRTEKRDCSRERYVWPEGFNAGGGNRDIMGGKRALREGSGGGRIKRIQATGNWQSLETASPARTRLARPRQASAAASGPLTCSSGNRRGCGRCCRAAPAAAPHPHRRPPRCSPAPARRRPAAPATSRPNPPPRTRPLRVLRSPFPAPEAEEAGGRAGVTAGACAKASCPRPGSVYASPRADSAWPRAAGRRASRLRARCGAAEVQQSRPRAVEDRAAGF